jgi:parvulin-like peptidyl-prolyl isomerase
MMKLLQVGEQVITPEDLLPLLTKYQMFPQLVREIIIDQAIAEINCTEEESQQALTVFCHQNRISNEKELQAYQRSHGLSQARFQELAVRGLKLEKYKYLTWENKLESYFLKRKQDLDRVIYSLIRTKDAAIAQELYFRIQEGEQSFASLAREYSEGAEAQTGGLIGPVEIVTPHPVLTELLRRSQPGELSAPNRAGEWIVIVRLEKYIPAQLDEGMRKRLLNELFTTWLQTEVQQQMQALQAVETSS